MKIIFIAAALAFATYFYFKRTFRANHIEKEITYGPFSIRAMATTGKSYDIGKGMVSYTNVAYAIYHNGQPLPFPAALQNNTGLPYLWRVYALAGTPEPTLLAGSQSLYLIYLKDGTPVVEPILEQHHDFAAVQFLDSENGQPGPYAEVFAKFNTENLDQLDTLEGGRYLLVSEHALLDVHTRHIQPLNPDNNSIDNYSFPSPHGALAFSPDRKSIVFRGQFQSWNTADEDLPDSEHALIVYHVEQDKGYAVKFDDTELRMGHTDDMNYAWFEQFFEWEKNTSGDQLKRKKLEKPPYWTGRLDLSNNSYPYYSLYPIQASMLPAFLTFLEQQAGWTKANIIEDKFHEYTGRNLIFAVDEMKYDVTLKEDEQVLRFSKYIYAEDNPEYTRVVKDLANKFEAELATGKHQEHFGKIISESKRIRN